MRRRQALTALSAALVGGAGCLDSPADPVAERAAVSSHPDPGTPDSCPEVVDPERCTLGGPADGPVRITRSKAKLSLPNGSVYFVLYNDSPDPLGTNFQDWHVHKWVDGEWHRLTDRVILLVADRLDPGKRYGWRFRVDNGSPWDGEPSRPTEEIAAPVLPRPLGPGTYAFTVAEAATTVRLTGDPVTRGLPDRLRVREESPGKIHLHDTGADGPHAYRLRRAPDAQPRETVVFEELMRFDDTPRYGQALFAAAEGTDTETVRLSGLHERAFEDTAVGDPRPAVAAGQPFAFQGSTYVIEEV